MRAVVRVALVALLLAVASCASGQHPAPSPPAVQPVAPPPAPCAGQGCTPGTPIPLTGGYSVRLWSFPTPTVTSSATPVVELSHDGQHAGWWVGRLGFGWAAKLTCLAGSTPNCMVTSALGAHAGSAETLFLRNGALVSPPRASVVFDSSAPTAADLDSDGLLDVAGMENDYKPNYALGHNYWATYRQSGAALHRTGCSPATGVPQPPTVLLHGPCPTVSQG